jgi:hypothetical protein
MNPRRSDSNDFFRERPILRQDNSHDRDVRAVFGLAIRICAVISATGAGLRGSAADRRKVGCDNAVSGERCDCDCVPRPGCHFRGREASENAYFGSAFFSFPPLNFFHTAQ